MSEQQSEDTEPALLHILRPDEELHVQARAIGGVLAVTDRRVVVTEGDRMALDVSHTQLRRIQFDIERDRPATLVIVPDSPAHPPEVLAIPATAYEEAARVLVLIGQRLTDPRG